MIRAYKGILPKIDSSSYISETAVITGDVTIASDCGVFDLATLRGDEGPIVLGANTNIQEHACLHTNLGDQLLLGKNVTVGHSAILHGCTVKDNVIIGMGSIVLDYAVINEHSIVAAGSVVPPNKIYPSKSLIMGSPAKVVRELRDDEIEMIAKNAEIYVGLAKDYL